MNFLRRNNSLNNKRNGWKIFIWIFIALVLVAAVTFSWTRNMLFGIASPFWQSKNFITSFISDDMGIFQSKAELLKENSDLKNQIKNFAVEDNLFQVVKSENDDLKSLLGRKASSKKEILASILEKPFLSPYDTLVVDAGSSDGISVGDKVLSDDASTFIGYVSEVFAGQSKVTLYSSPGQKVEVLIGKNNVLKDAYGSGGGNFIAEVPREFDIKEGDPIVIPSVSANVFGIVETINYKEADSFETVMFKNPVNIEELKWVVVLPEN